MIKAVNKFYSEYNLNELENKLNYKFKDKSLLITALAHPSLGEQFNYERSEFLGDAVLELVISDRLFKKYPDFPEGDLTKLRANIVCAKSLTEIASSIDLGSYLLLGKGEELTGGRHKPSILENATEALIGAVYLDGGFESAKSVIHRLFEKAVAEEVSKPVSDYKTRLQEAIHKTSKLPIKYNVVKKTGPPHKTVFYVELIIGDKIICEGSGLSKKAAEQNAAKQALDTFDNSNK